MRHVISVHDLTVEVIIDVLDRAEGMLDIARGKAYHFRDDWDATWIE